IASRVGRVAAERSLWVLGAGVAVSGAAGFGGVAAAAGQAVKMNRALQDGKHTEFALYALSSMSFFFQGATNLLQFGGAFSEFMIARGSRRAIWFTGSRFVAGASTRLIAATGLGL